MVTYVYARELLTENDHILEEKDHINEWNIDNPYRTDAEGNQIHLTTEIAAAIPAKGFACPSMVCDGVDCSINFIEDLTPEEIAILTTTVNNHKNNV